MGRPLWFVAGAGAGMYAAVRARRAAEAFTPDGLRDRVRGWQLGARMFAEEVQTHRAERETQLREHLGLEPQLTALTELPTRTAPETKDQP